MEAKMIDYRDGDSWVPNDLPTDEEIREILWCAKDFSAEVRWETQVGLTLGGSCMGRISLVI